MFRLPTSRLIVGYLERRAWAEGPVAERVIAQMLEGGILVVGCDSMAVMTAEP